MTQAYTNRFTEVHEVAGFLQPQTLAVGTHTYGYYNMANHQRGVLVIMVGEMARDATLDCQLWQATDAAGTGAKVIAGKAITQLTQAGGDGNDIVAIEARTEEMDVDGRFSYVSGILTVAGGTVDCAVIGFAGCSNYVPVSVANWTEIVD